MARSVGYDPTLPGPKPDVLPAKLTPIIVAPGGPEPPSSGSYVLRSNQLSYGCLMVSSSRFELETFGFSIQRSTN